MVQPWADDAELERGIRLVPRQERIQHEEHVLDGTKPGGEE
jgi:hypothetical protein